MSPLTSAGPPVLLLIPLLPLLLWPAACTPPVRDYAPDAIAVVDQLDELMHVQATVADPRFKLARQKADGKLDEDDFAAFADMARRLIACAEVLPRFSEEPGFHEFSRVMGAQSRELQDLVAAREGAAVVSQALAIRATCRACHDAYR